MGQIKVFGLKQNLEKNKVWLSETIHQCVVEAFV